MKTRVLGSQGLITSEVGYGCMGLSNAYGAADDPESQRTLQQAFDLSITLFDTSDAYGNGHNERLVGNALEHVRNHVLIATKFGIVNWSNTDKKRPDIKLCARPEYVRQACEASLKRLNTETIDLYYLHRLDPNVPIEDTVGAMADLVQEGKIRAIGLSEVSSTTLRRAHSVHPISAVQSEYSLWSRTPEREILKTCQKLGVGFVAYSPLGRGFLTGHIRSNNDLKEGDMRQFYPRFKKENLKHNLGFITRISEIAQEKKCTLSQLSLAWLLAQGDQIVPIPSTKHIAHLKENLLATDITLTDYDLALLDGLLSDFPIAGERLPEMAMNLVDQEKDSLT
jgi:aryl-alcohol dehydrogenase-like predicted oxidoreductase